MRLTVMMERMWGMRETPTDRVWTQIVCIIFTLVKNTMIMGIATKMTVNTFVEVYKVWPAVGMWLEEVHTRMAGE